MGKVYNFYSCNVLRDGKLEAGDIWFRNGIFINPQDVDFTADVHIDCQGAIVAPSFIDLKLNGALGVHFADKSSITEEKLTRLRAFLPYTGVTLFCPTIDTWPSSPYPELLKLLPKSSCDPHSGAGLLGVHLDGPFQSIKCSNERKHVREYEVDVEKTLQNVYGNDLDNVAIVTLAPELAYAMEAIKFLHHMGIVVSIGHTEATYDVARQAVTNGASMITHLFNAMPDFHHRDPGVIGLLCDDTISKNLSYTIIADKYHVHPAALRMAYKISPRALTLCSDGQAPIGLGPGVYVFNGCELTVEENDGLSLCYSEGKLYGSVCPFHRAVRNLQEITNCSLAFALDAASKKPAQKMGLYPRKGSLAVGSDADFVLLKPGSLDLVATFIAGHKVADNKLNSNLEILQLTVQQPAYYSPSLDRENLPDSPERIVKPVHKNLPAKGREPMLDRF